jgi:hypothetical protein
MSNIVNINMDGTWATVKTAFETMGFTVTEDNDVYTCYYTADTNAKMYYKLTKAASTQYNVTFCNSDNRSQGTVGYDYGASYKITYQLIGNSLAFGFCSSNIPYSFYNLIISPISQEDDWYYTQYGVSSKIFNGRTELNFVMPATKLYSSNASVQIIKIYDGAQFLNNIYQTTVSPSIDGPTTGSNTIDASIGEDIYKIINIHTVGVSNSAIALKIPSSS